MSDLEREVLGVVRTHDRNRYLAALFAPRDLVAPLLSLYAFNAELCRIGLSVSEPMLGEIRLQWWRDALLYGQGNEETGHPIADAFRRNMAQFQLPDHVIMGMIDAHGFDVSGGAMPDHHALNVYLGKSEGAVFQLAAAITGIRGPEVDAAATFAGRSYGFAEKLRMLPVDLKRGHMPLPRSELLGNRLSKYELSGFDSEIRHAREEAVKRLETLPKKILPAFLPLALIDPILQAVKERGSDLSFVPEVPPVSRLWRLWRAKRSGVF